VPYVFVILTFDLFIARCLWYG